MMKRNKCFLLGFVAFLCLMPIKALSQNLSVEGTVSDEFGEPLIGVSVIIQGQGAGAVTDLDGHFRIQSVSASATLEFSYVGYLTQSLKPKSNMVVTMQPDTKSSGWWSTTWTGADFQPGTSDLLKNNGDGTWTLEINLTGDPICDVIDVEHLLFTGDRFTPLKLYYQE